jgi:hypothetical protein
MDHQSTGALLNFGMSGRIHSEALLGDRFRTLDTDRHRPGHWGMAQIA